MLNHIGIQTADASSTKLIIENILELTWVNKFNLSQEICSKIFSQNESENIIVEVFQGKNYQIELFHCQNNVNTFTYSHICVNVDNIENIIEKANKHKIEYVFLKRNHIRNLLFLKDSSNNKFEIYELLTQNEKDGE